MSRQSKRTSAPAPAPATATAPAPQGVPSLGVGGQTTSSPAMPSTFAPAACFPPCPLPQSMPPPSTLNWPAGLQRLGMAGSSSSQGPWWPPVGAGSQGLEDPDVQAWGVDFHPPGGLVNLLNKTTTIPAQGVSNGSSSQPSNTCDDKNYASRSEKRLQWTKEEDLVLVGAWLNNSKDPIQANYKKNDQYWKAVTAAYNSAIPKNRARQVKQVKDRFGRTKKRVTWFCDSWKEANSLWASGESDVDLMDRALKLYENEHKQNGPFMFKHCWDVLRNEPKWDAYLERLEDIEPEKRKFDENVEEQFSLEDTIDERPIGGKKAKQQQKRKRKEEACIIDLDGELTNFIEAQNKANEGRKEMLETQKLVSSEKLEAQKLAYLAAKENKEAGTLEAYRELLKQDTTRMPEDVRAEHVLALKCLREKIFGN